MPAGKAPKGARKAAPASGRSPGRNPTPRPLLPPRAAGRADLRARPALATPLEVCHWRADGKAPVPFEEVREFVDSLLLLRGSSPLETFELRVAGAAIDVRHVRLWVSYTVQCKVQVLRLS